MHISHVTSIFRALAYAQTIFCHFGNLPEYIKLYKCECIAQTALSYKRFGVLGNAISYAAYCSTHTAADSGRAGFWPTSFLIKNTLHQPGFCLFQ